MQPAVVAGMVGVLLLAGLSVGAGGFAAAVLVLAFVALVDLSGLFRRQGSPPVLPAALVPGVALPAGVALRPAEAWETFPRFVVAGLLIAVFLILLFGRRRETTAALSATLLAGLVVGMGAAGLLLLSHLPDGFRWALGFVLIATVASIAAAVAERPSSGRRGTGRRGGSEPPPLVTAPLAAAAALAVVAVLTLRPPFDPEIAAAFAVTAVLAGWAGRVFAGPVREGGPAGKGGQPRGGDGLATRDTPTLRGVLALRSGGALLLGAPVAYAVARWAAL